eukprot:228433-Hanusia_phi.AAC.6
MLPMRRQPTGRGVGGGRMEGRATGSLSPQERRFGYTGEEADRDEDYRTMQSGGFMSDTPEDWSHPYGDEEDVSEYETRPSFKSLRPFSNVADGRMNDRHRPDGALWSGRQENGEKDIRRADFDEILMEKERELEFKDEMIRSLQAEVKGYKEQIRALDQQRGSYPRFMDLPANIRPEDVEDAFRLRATAEQAASEGADMLEKALESEHNSIEKLV